MQIRVSTVLVPLELTKDLCAVKVEEATERCGWGVSHRRSCWTRGSTGRECVVAKAADACDLPHAGSDCISKPLPTFRLPHGLCTGCSFPLPGKLSPQALSGRSVSAPMSHPGGGLSDLPNPSPSVSLTSSPDLFP